LKMNVQSIKIVGRRINHRSRIGRKGCMYKVNRGFDVRTIIIIQVIEWDIGNKMMISRSTRRKSIIEGVETLRRDGAKTMKVKDIKPRRGTGWRSRETRKGKPFIRSTGKGF